MENSEVFGKLRKNDLRSIADKKGLKYKESADKEALIKKISAFVSSHGLHIFLHEIPIYVFQDLIDDQLFEKPKKQSKHYLVDAFETAVEKSSLSKVLEGLMERKKGVVQSMVDEGCPYDSDDENMDYIDRIEKSVRAYGQGSVFIAFTCDELTNFAERSGLKISLTQSASILIDCLMERTNYEKKNPKRKN